MSRALIVAAGLAAAYIGQAMAAPSPQCRQAMTQFELQEAALDRANQEKASASAEVETARKLSDSVSLQLAVGRFDRALGQGLGAMRAMAEASRVLAKCGNKAAAEAAKGIDAEADKLAAAIDAYAAERKAAEAKP